MPAIGAAQRLHNLIARVDVDLCAACGQCVEVCPTGALTLQDMAVVDDARCVGCGSCVEQCPMEAISLTDRSAE
jgi:NAD-dependent dihydropyrimidine dehydrogenase PreA subunit